MRLTVTTHSPGETDALGKALGRLAYEGAVFALTGALGTGKTVFVQGLARGLGVPDTFYVTSPSYTLINEYPGEFTLYHADLYRLADSDDIESTGLYDMLHGACVVAIEWAERISAQDLADHVAIDFRISDEGARKIRFVGYGQCGDNLLRELEKNIKECLWL